ncbi:hypothetical protein [Denitratisoma oestradiolicum]|uniref:Uncharacterized protein n=1 Tax=Denitratisoma oestradiolicum TaxID=311182 RepID=A0A6S6YTM2_9PROT|nr:hypothetical protein [Denitratisoma oestradiolicum]CAB1370832.1 protein of unknown function [Denitratisoma oestradiolicum]
MVSVFGGMTNERKIRIYYNERELTALRVGLWKGHFKTREGFFDWNKPAALMFHLRMDPFEKQDGSKSQHMAMEKSWIGGLMRDVLGQHMMSLKKFQPRQKGSSLVLRDVLE